MDYCKNNCSECDDQKWCQSAKRIVGGITAAFVCVLVCIVVGATTSCKRVETDRSANRSIEEINKNLLQAWRSEDNEIEFFENNNVKINDEYKNYELLYDRGTYLTNDIGNKFTSSKGYKIRLSGVFVFSFTISENKLILVCEYRQEGEKPLDPPIDGEYSNEAPSKNVVTEKKKMEALASRLAIGKQICVNSLKKLNVKSAKDLDSYEKKALARELAEIEKLAKSVNVRIEELNSLSFNLDSIERRRNIQEEFKKFENKDWIKDVKETTKKKDKALNDKDAIIDLNTEKVLEEALK